MTCRKGDFYIIKKGFVPQKVSGYIIGGKIGFCRNEHGEFYPTELKSGMSLAITKWYMIIENKYNGVFNLLNAYRAFIECKLNERKLEEFINNIMSQPDAIMLKCIKAIKEAHKAEREAT